MDIEKIYRKSQMKKKLFFIPLLSFFLILVLLAGCVNKKSYSEGYQFTNNWMKEFAAIKNPKLYKPKIEEVIRYFQDPALSDEAFKNLKATKLMLAYSRLFFIEEERGNLCQADIYFQKARYWSLISSECYTSDTPKETDKVLKRFTKVNVKFFIKKLNPEFTKRIDSMAKAEKGKKSVSDLQTGSSQKI